MRFTLRHGKASGKINLIDIVLLFFLILIMLILYNRVFPFKSFDKLHDIPGEKWMSVDLIVPSELEWLHKYISKGDKQKGLQNKIFAEVIDMSWTREFDNKERLMLKFKILTTLESGQYPLAFGRHPIKIGELIVFETDKYILNGYIAGVEEINDVKK